MKTVLLLPLLFIIASCSTKKSNSLHKEDTYKDSSAIGSLNLIDSISKQDTLTIDQMRHTVIDTDYFVPGCIFWGESVIARKSKYLLALVNYSDASVCLDKFLLIFNAKSGANTDIKLVNTECDIDGSSGHIEYSYSIIDNFIFKTTEIIQGAPVNNKTRVTEIKRKWKVNQLGKIVVLDSTSSISYEDVQD